MLGFGLLITGCVPTSQILYKDDKVVVKEKSLVNVLNVHASKDTTVMTLFGKTYEEVRGAEPFYLEIPGRDSILFVTGREYDNGQATVHIVNVTTKQEVHFPAFDSSIGENICATNKEKEFGGFERVESLNGDKLIINACSRTGISHYRYFLDLQKCKFEKQDSSRTSETNVFIWPEGRKP